jgi:hypothetical protein
MHGTQKEAANAAAVLCRVRKKCDRGVNVVSLIEFVRVHGASVTSSLHFTKSQGKDGDSLI